MSERISRTAWLHRLIVNGLCHANTLCKVPKRDPSYLNPDERYLLTPLFSILVLIFSFFTVAAPAQASGVNYVYDSLGRLITVYDLAGNAAVYSYDAVGNLQSITNYPATQFKPIELSSGRGSAGSNITIYGTGFCSNPSVTFNGLAATVVSVTTTQIVVTVPAGATTGPVIVTCGSNQFSAGTFTLGSSAPSVTSFSPTIGGSGTAVTINGTNFQTIPAANAVYIGVRPAPVSSATTTVLNTSVPSGTTTGHISVTTSTGQGVSAGYFFVPPSPATQSTLVTGQMTIGGSSVNVTTSTATPYAQLAFDGTAGQQISLNVTADTIGNANFYVLAPGGNAIGNGFFSNSGGTVADVSLPITGTYSVFIVPAGNNGGSVTLQLFSTATDVPISGLVIGGAAVTTAGPNLPGQDFSGTFSGTAGQQISLNVTADTVNDATFYIIPPGGTVSNAIGSVRVAFGSTSGIAADVNLPTTGTYSIFVDPNSNSTGGFTLQLFSTTDVPINGLVIGGSVVSAGPNLPGQDFLGTFAGTAGQQISLNVTADSVNDATFYIIPPGGTVSNAIGSVRVAFGSTSGIAADVNLLTTGTYSVFVEPNGSSTGSFTLQLSSTTDLPINGLVIGGPAVSAGPNLPGQDFMGTFGGTAGQQISLNVTSDTVNDATFYIIPPGGTVSNAIGSVRVAFGSTSGIAADVNLLTTGTYSVFVEPNGSSTGSFTLQLSSTTDLPINGLVIDGSAVTAGPNLPGQDFLGTLSGTAGQQISLNVTADTVNDATFYIIPPGGTVSNAIGSVRVAFGSTSGIAADVNLLTTGTYSIFVEPNGSSTGSFTLQLFSTTDAPINGLAIGGSAVSAGPNQPGQDFLGTFSGTAGQQISLNVTADSVNDATFYIIPPGGTVSNAIGSVRVAFGSTSGSVTGVNLLTTGTYSVFVEPNGSPTGSFTLTLTSP